MSISQIPDPLSGQIAGVAAQVAALTFGAVQSIQTGYLDSVTATGRSGTAEDNIYKDLTVTSVNTAKSFVILHSMSCYNFDNTPTESDWVTARLTSSTNLRFGCRALQGTGGGTRQFSGRWYIVELK